MFGRILVPVDGSVRAEQAIAVAARIAHASGGSVILLRVVSNSDDLWIGGLPPRRPSDTPFSPALAEAERYLAGLTRSPNLQTIPTEMVTLVGSPAQVILSVASSYQADLIVMCSHGHTGFVRALLGSVAEKVARHAHLPVLILRDGGPIPAGLHPDVLRPLRMLVALDGTAYAKTALLPAANLIWALSAPAQGALHLVRVISPPAGKEHDSGYARDLQKAKTYLQRTSEHIREGFTASPARNLHLALSWSVAVGSDVAEALIRVAENGEDAEGTGVFGGCDVVALATHGRSGMQRWVLGSVTERVLAGTRLPLFIVRPLELMDRAPLYQGQKSEMML